MSMTGLLHGCLRCSMHIRQVQKAAAGEHGMISHAQFYHTAGKAC